MTTPSPSRSSDSLFPTSASIPSLLDTSDSSFVFSRTRLRELFLLWLSLDETRAQIEDYFLRTKDDTQIGFLPESERRLGSQLRSNQQLSTSTCGVFGTSDVGLSPDSPLARGSSSSSPSSPENSDSEEKEKNEATANSNSNSDSTSDSDSDSDSSALLSTAPVLLRQIQKHQYRRQRFLSSTYRLNLAPYERCIAPESGRSRSRALSVKSLVSSLGYMDEIPRFYPVRVGEKRENGSSSPKKVRTIDIGIEMDELRPVRRKVGSIVELMMMVSGIGSGMQKQQQVQAVLQDQQPQQKSGRLNLLVDDVLEFLGLSRHFREYFGTLCRRMIGQQRKGTSKGTKRKEFAIDGVMQFVEKMARRTVPMRYFMLLLEGVDGRSVSGDPVIELEDQDRVLRRRNFVGLLKALLLQHPSLEFLKSTPAFQKKYAETVLVRLMYSLAPTGENEVSFSAFRNSAFVEAVKCISKKGEGELTSINDELEFFSYEHFYVLYCKFWELDADHDFEIGIDDLREYSSSSLASRAIRRIFEGAPKELTGSGRDRMSFEDFVWFCLSEEDKTSRASLIYWFRCADLDGSGAILKSEMEYFFEEQILRLKKLTNEEIRFADVWVQILDMVRPERADRITMRDISRSGMSCIFFDILFNLTKFLMFEQRGFAILRNRQNLSPWAFFARVTYDCMSQDDDQPDEDASASDDDDDEEDDEGPYEEEEEEEEEGEIGGAGYVLVEQRRESAVVVSERPRRNRRSPNRRRRTREGVRGKKTVVKVRKKVRRRQ